MTGWGLGRGLALVIALGVGLAAGAGCKNKKKDEPATVPVDPNAGEPVKPVEPAPVAQEVPKLTIHVTWEDDGNEGRPLYAVVRAVTFKDFVEDRYQDIADLVVAPDETVLASFVVFPGTARDITIAKPEGKTVGVYLLLTKANGTSWKRLFEEPESIAVVVGRDRLLLAEEQKESGDAIEKIGG